MDVMGSGTSVTKPITGLNVADCPAARPVTFTAEKVPAVKRGSVISNVLVPNLLPQE